MFDWNAFKEGHLVLITDGGNSFGKAFLVAPFIADAFGQASGPKDLAAEVVAALTPAIIAERGGDAAEYVWATFFEEGSTGELACWVSNAYYDGQTLAYATPALHLGQLIPLIQAHGITVLGDLHDYA